MSETRWHVYIVECADRTLYTGVAVNLSDRLDRHNDGSGARYTRGRRPVRLVYAEAAADQPPRAPADDAAAQGTRTLTSRGGEAGG